MTTQYDSLNYAKRLERAGVSAEQAAIYAYALSDILANAVVARQLAEVETRLRQEIRDTAEKIEGRLSARIEQVKTELSAQIDTLEASLRGDINQLRWMFGTILAANLTIIIKLFFP